MKKKKNGITGDMVKRLKPGNFILLMATNFSPSQEFYVLNQFQSIVIFGIKGFYVSASGAIQGHHGPLVFVNRVRSTGKKNSRKTWICCYVPTQLFLACTCVYLFLVSPVAIFRTGFPFVEYCSGSFRPCLQSDY